MCYYPSRYPRLPLTDTVLMRPRFDGGYTSDLKMNITRLLLAHQAKAVAFGGLGVSPNPVGMQPPSAVPSPSLCSRLPIHKLQLPLHHPHTVPGPNPRRMLRAHSQVMSPPFPSPHQHRNSSGMSLLWINRKTSPPPSLSLSLPHLSSPFLMPLPPPPIPFGVVLPTGPLGRH